MYSCDHSNAPRLWDSGPQILGIFLASSVEVAMVGTHGDRGVASASFSECVDTTSTAFCRLATGRWRLMILVSESRTRVRFLWIRGRDRCFPENLAASLVVGSDIRGSHHAQDEEGERSDCGAG